MNKKTYCTDHPFLLIKKGEKEHRWKYFVRSSMHNTHFIFIERIQFSQKKRHVIDSKICTTKCGYYISIDTLIQVCIHLLFQTYEENVLPHSATKTISFTLLCSFYTICGQLDLKSFQVTSSLLIECRPFNLWTAQLYSWFCSALW